MEYTKPRVYLIAFTALGTGMWDWIRNEFGDSAEALLDSRFEHAKAPSSQEIETLIEFAARRCYRSFAPGLNSNVSKIRKDQAEYLENIVKQRHGSVIAHASMTFAIEGCSRVFTHELVRNAVGNAFSQESMRYVRMDSFTMRLPGILGLFGDRLANVMRNLELSLGRIRQEAEEAAGSDAESFQWKKAFTSALRHFMPNVTTGIVVTLNLRSLRWLCEQRTDPSADEEMREIAFMIYEKALPLAPTLLDGRVIEDDLSFSGKRKQVKFESSKI